MMHVTITTVPETCFFKLLTSKIKYHMLSFKNQWHVTLVNTFYTINLIKSVNECHVTLIFKT